MAPGEMLFPDMAFEQAYPSSNGLIIVGSARRQNTSADNTFEGGLLAFVLGHQRVQDMEQTQEAGDNDLSLERKRGASLLLRNNDQMAEERSKAASVKTKAATFAKPPGIDDIGVGLSPVVVEKPEQSATAFGLIQPEGDISFKEFAFVSLEKSRRVFGLVME